MKILRTQSLVLWWETHDPDRFSLVGSVVVILTCVGAKSERHTTCGSTEGVHISPSPLN